MTNFEFYKDEITQMTNNNIPFALKNNKPLRCDSVNCNDCEFGSDAKCYSNMFKWLYEEHVENPVLTSREWHLLKALEDGYIARDKNGARWWYEKKPKKRSEDWGWGRGSFFAKMEVLPNLLDFIKWEDTEPHSVEEMLMWEHEEE